MYESKISEWAAGRAELINLQREAFAERQKFEMNLRKEEHDKKLKLELDILEIKKQDQISQKVKNDMKADLELEILSLQREALITQNELAKRTNK